MKKGLATVMHLVDSALPVGGYVYSHGLETAYQRGRIPDNDALEAYLAGYLQSIALSELPFIKAGFVMGVEDAAGIAAMADYYHALVNVPAMRKASLAQGHNLIRVVDTLYPEAPAWTSILSRAKRHYSVVYGLAMVDFLGDVDAACESFLFMALRDQMSAAVRLSVIGPMEANTMQYRLLDYIASLSVASPDNYEASTRSSYLIDMYQAGHARLYTRLFQT